MNNIFNSLVFVVGVVLPANVSALDAGEKGVQHDTPPQLSQEDQEMLDQRLAILSECSERVHADLDVNLEEDPYNEAHSDALYKCMMGELNKPAQP